jgi:hypothetical protein
VVKQIIVNQALAGAILLPGTASRTSCTFTTPAFIATVIGGVIAAFGCNTKSLKRGYCGWLLYGDKILARVNSGEMIANSDQQKTL